MAVKKTVRSNVKKVISQARQSLRLLEAIERDALSKAKGFASLRKLGLATTEDLEKLRLRVERLEGELATLRTSSASDRVIPQG